MNDITDLMLQYRECCKLVWNDFYKQHPSFVNYWDCLDAFNDVAVRLFSILVLSKSGIPEIISKSPSYKAHKNVLNNIRVRLKTPDARVAIERVKGQGCYWDHPIDVLTDSQVDFRFIDFFDFDKQGPLQYEYYLVRIVQSTTYPEIVGHDALIKVECCVVEAFNEN